MGFGSQFYPKRFNQHNDSNRRRRGNSKYELNRQLTFARFGPAWIPPQKGEEEEWQTIEAKVTKFLKKELTNSVEILKDFDKLEAISKASGRPNSDEFLAALKDWQTSLADRADDRAEGDSVASEVSYYRRDYFSNGLVYFIFAFLVSAVGWIIREGRGGKIVAWMASVIYGIATAYVLGGVSSPLSHHGTPSGL